MSEKPQKQNEQLHTDSLLDGASEPEEYSLEEIMREFGGWSKRQPPEQAPDIQPPASGPEQSAPAEDTPPPEPDIKIWTADAHSPKPAKQRQRGSEKPAAGAEPALPIVELPILDRHAPAKEPQRHDRVQSEQAKKPPQRPLRVKPSAQHQKKAEAAPKRLVPPERVWPTAQEAYRETGRVPALLRLRVFLVCVVCAVSVVFMFFSQGGWSLAGLQLKAEAAAAVQLALMLLATVLAPEVLVKGITQCLQLRFNLEALVSCSVIVMGIHGCTSISSGQMPFCVVGSLGLLFGLWSDLLQRQAQRLSLKAAQNMDGPTGIFVQSQAWEHDRCVLRSPTDADGLVPPLLGSNVTERAMRIYAPMALAISLTMALLAWAKKEIGFLWAWSAMLSACVPMGGMIAFSRPFARLSKRLYRSGAALCGWSGAKALHTANAVILKDRDLFPPSNLSMSGMKIFGDYNVSLVVGYVCAVIGQAGGSLVPLFQELMENQNGRNCTVDQFKRYEAGGLGAEIYGDVVLVGSLAFMQLMGVHMAEGTKVKQAVYISINGELAGVFAINYVPSGASRSALQALCHNRRLKTVLAVQDFMITPSLLHKKYQVATGALEYPPVEKRMQLSDTEPDETALLGAMLGRESFSSLAEVLLGGQTLWSVSWVGTVISIVSGLIGLCMMSFLVYLGAAATACGFNAMLYSLIWLAPMLLLTQWVKGS